MAYAKNLFNTPHAAPYISGLNIYGADAASSVFTLVNGECIDSTGYYFIKINDGSGFISIDLNTTGANGLDTGTAANNTWYAVYAIASYDNSLNAGLASLSATSPTLPGGYNTFRLVGFIQTATAPNYYPFMSYSSFNLRTHLYLTNDTHLRLLNAGTATALTNLTSSLPNIIPSTLWQVSAINFYYSYTPNSAANIFTLIGSNAGTGSDNCIFCQISGNVAAQVQQGQVIVADPGVGFRAGNGNQFSYKVQNGSDSLTLFCTGFNYYV